MNYTKKLGLFFVACLGFVSCDKDFNTIGSDVIGDQNFNLSKYNSLSINSYIKATNEVQTNNLTVNQLGIYPDPVFGTTKASFVTQIEMVSPNPTLRYNYQINSTDSVYIYIPFFSTVKKTDASGNRIFSIDSIYGSSASTFDLKVYRNGYFLSTYDPASSNQETQKYYSDAKSLVDSNKGTEVLNDDPNSSQNSAFFFNKNEIKIYKTNGNGQYYNSANAITTNPAEYVVKERKAPGIWLNLNKNFFKTTILDAIASGKLVNNDVFKDYFRGLYFEVNENSPNQGSLAKLDFLNAELVIQYHSYEVSGDTNPANLKKNVLRFQMGFAATGTKKSNSINLFEYPLQNPNYTAALNGTNTDGKLYIKGGNGSVAFIELFDNAELTLLKSKKWLINEASLVFYIDQSSMSNALYEPERIYLYDASTGNAIVDYTADFTNATNAKFNKSVFGGILEKDGNGKGIKYKFKITNFINNLINGTNTSTNTNVRLGLVISDNINISSTIGLKQDLTIDSEKIKTIPTASILNVGTVLYGAQETDATKRLKLEIIYTEPN
ncbi:MAG TPA: DUF4270 domain-containing protein [Flavobacterium sp.]|nr:DUF4270 domain-containing protein [Flavobacterium sp.]